MVYGFATRDVGWLAKRLGQQELYGSRTLQIKFIACNGLVVSSHSNVKGVTSSFSSLFAVLTCSIVEMNLIISWIIQAPAGIVIAEVVEVAS